MPTKCLTKLKEKFEENFKITFEFQFGVEIMFNLYSSQISNLKRQPLCAVIEKKIQIVINVFKFYFDSLLRISQNKT